LTDLLGTDKISSLSFFLSFFLFWKEALWKIRNKKTEDGIYFLIGQCPRPTTDARIFFAHMSRRNILRFFKYDCV